MSEKLEAYYGLPSEVKFCKKCVISNQRPSSTVEFKSEKGEKKKVINFNEEDVCSACVYHEEKETNIDWKERDEKLRFAVCICILMISGNSYVMNQVKAQIWIHTLFV